MEEDTILLHMEKHFEPKPAALFTTEQEKDALQWSVDQFMRRFTTCLSNTQFSLSHLMLIRRLAK